jgi:diguanylate cyclase (GGDEF)-like protein/PAS domain S-box-containing protein
MKTSKPPKLDRLQTCLANLTRPSELSTQCRVLSVVMLALVGILLITSIQSLRISHRDVESTLQQQASSQLGYLLHAVSDAVVARDYGVILSHLRTHVEKGDLLEAAYIDRGGYALHEWADGSQADRPEWFASMLRLKKLSADRAIVIGGTHYGQIHIQLSPHAYEDLLWHLDSRLFVWFTVSFLLLGWLIHALLKINLKGFFQIQTVARRFEAGDYSARATLKSGHPPEIRETEMAFNHMGEAVGNLLNALKEHKKAIDHAAIVSETDLNGAITYVNDRFCEVSGYPREELIGQNHRIINSGWHDPEFFHDMWNTITQGRIWNGELCNLAKDGRQYWTESTITPILGEDGLPHKYLSIRFDVTQRKRSEATVKEEKERWQVTLFSINDAVIIVDADNQVGYLNPAAEVMLEVALEDAQSRPLKQLFRLARNEAGEAMSSSTHASANHDDALFKMDTPPLRAKTGSVWLQTPSGNHLAVSYSCAPLTGNGGYGAIYVLRDETEKKQLLDSLREMAFHDALTTLPNRRAVEGRLSRALRTAREESQQHAFCYIDLDHFKLVNDTCGHSVGDILLATVAQNMRKVLPENAYLGRLGGDEFGLILFDTQPEQVKSVCARIIRCIREYPFEHKGRRFNLGACVGVSMITGQSTTIENLMIQADMACYRAKAEGSGRIRVYEADEVGFRRLEKEMGWAADFSKALESGQFMPYRQLIQTVSTAGKSHYEVLIRVRRPNGEVEGPGSLLLALERYSQAPILDRWMTEKVIDYLSRTPEDQSVYFINLSGKTLVDESFLDTVNELLDRYQLPGSRIGFEITETAAVVNLENAQRLILGLRGRGCQFALDDFGQEASSFSYLKCLPADFIKVDGAFVRGMANDKRDQAIVRSIAQLARSFGMQTVAEQVETAEVAAMLTEMGVDYLQGYQIHRPEPLPNWYHLPKQVHPETAVKGADRTSIRLLT